MMPGAMRACQSRCQTRCLTENPAVDPSVLLVGAKALLVAACAIHRLSIVEDMLGAAIPHVQGRSGASWGYFRVCAVYDRTYCGSHPSSSPAHDRSPHPEATRI
jgi:hypothetical protein